ncbi:MAG TPA: RsmE family RNA methyltransferase [Kofleriaceae bacterium]|nr:RsmE family RNA methyltransferase [Kofleriaceae bacterium]
MIRVFVAPLAAGELAIEGDEHHYLARVRRARAGDPIELVDRAGQRARGVIVRIAADHTIVRADAVEAATPAPPAIRALVPLIKGDRMELCLEKLVEVGADAIVVFPAARSVVRLDGDRVAPRIARYRAAAEAAARQSGRALVPDVGWAESLALALAGAVGQRFVLDPGAEAALPAIAEPEVTLISGPEGGLAPGELDQVTAAGFAPLGLGPRVLRAETAPVVAVALIRAHTAS